MRNEFGATCKLLVDYYINGNPVYLKAARQIAQEAGMYLETGSNYASLEEDNMYCVVENDIFQIKEVEK